MRVRYACKNTRNSENYVSSTTVPPGKEVNILNYM